MERCKKILSTTSIYYRNLIPLIQYSLIDVCEEKQHVVLHVNGKSANITRSFSEVIGDSSIIENLRPLEACWIGAHYGRALRSSVESGEVLKKIKKMPFLLKNKPCKYKIIFLNRDWSVGYLERKTLLTYTEHPLTIARNEHIICGFDSIQACYIGILAGILMEKTINLEQKTGEKMLDKLFKKAPKLRLAK
jgi:hypothetical protein